MKPTLSLLLAGLILLGLTACGGKSRPNITEPAASEPAVTEQAQQGKLPGASQSAAALHSGIREDGSFDEGTLFLGDSLTYSLVELSLRRDHLLGDARYAGRCGGPLTLFTDGSVLDGTNGKFFFSEEFLNMTLPEVVDSMGEDATAIYYMFGTNYTTDADSGSYIEILDYILSACPNATVYLQTVPYSEKIPCEKINDRILGAWERYRQMGEDRVQLLDVFTATDYRISADGIHLSDLGVSLWRQAIYDYAREHNIPQ